MSKVYEHLKQFVEEGPQHPDEMRPDEDPLSNCCTSPFTYPGWPDSDICSDCGEHADLGEDDD